MVDFQCKARYNWEDLLEITRLLRAPGGCPWDREQTHDSIRRNFLEETYEVLDALDRDDPHAMCEELGDILMQVALHAQIEAEQGRFTMEDVVDGVSQKLVYRHPHVFGAARADTTEEVLTNWEALKRTEKGQRSTADAIEAVPHTLPALWRAEKIASKTAKAGFDWSSAVSALGKLEEEVRELRQALEAGGPAEASHGVREELGDLLFISAKIGQMSGVDPEEALHLACDKFDRRFRRVETAAEAPAGIHRGGAGGSLEERQGTVLNASALRNKWKYQRFFRRINQMNKAELINAVAASADVSRKDTEAVITAMLDTITEALKQGDKVQLVGFGSFEVKKRAARIGRNPRTKEEIEIPATVLPVFKAGKLLKDTISK